MQCPKCGKQLADGAKFCGGCGTKLGGGEAGFPCPKCGAMLKAGAKFCGKCGTKLGEAAPAASGAAPVSADQRKDFSLVGGYIHWNVLPGQIAVKIDENDIAAYGKVKGISVQDGVKALFFVQGKLIAELEAGNYGFKNMGVEEFTPAKTVTNAAPAAKAEEKAAKKKGFFARTIGFIADHLPGKHKERAAAAGLTSRIPANIPPVSIVLIRSTEFPFIFDFKDVNTANLRSEVGVNFMCKITNINAFYANQLVDKKFVCFDGISKAVEPVVKNILDSSLSQISPDQINGNAQVQQTVLQQITVGLTGVYDYLAVTKLVSLSSTNEDLEVIRLKREELYINELELAELTKRNDFLNRLKDEENNQLLRAASTQVDFEAAMEEIDERHEMNVEEREKFRMLLETQKKLRLAKNDDEIEAAMLEFKKNKLLRDEEVDNLEFLIKHNRTVRDMDETQALTLATMENEFTLAKVRAQNEFDLKKLNALNEFDFNKMQVQNETEIDRLRLQREMEVGNARIQNELNRQRMQDEYTDSRRDIDLEAEAKRRRMENALDDEEMKAQMERLRMAQQIRHDNESFEHNLEEDTKAKEHQRAMEAQNAANLHEQEMAAQEQKHEEEMRRMFQGMSAEQIMAANPDISEAAAAALAEKFKSDNKDEILKKQEELMAARQADQDKMSAMMMQQMQMMQQMAMTGMQANAMNDQKIIQMQQGELDRTRADATANQDRFLQGMQTTIQSVGGAMHQPNVVYQQVPGGQPVAPVQPSAPVQPVAPETKVAGKVCPKCGAMNGDDLFCYECGEQL